MSPVRNFTLIRKSKRVILLSARNIFLEIQLNQKFLYGVNFQLTNYQIFN
jgi:hypothetical protein